MGFRGGAAVKNLLVNAGDTGSIPGTGRSPGVGNGNPLQYSCLKISTYRGPWRVFSPWGHKESDMTKHTHACNIKCPWAMSLLLLKEL